MNTLARAARAACLVGTALVVGCASPSTVGVEGGLLTGNASVRVESRAVPTPEWAAWSACLAEQQSTRVGDVCVCGAAFPRLAVLPDFDHCYAPNDAPPTDPAPPPDDPAPGAEDAGHAESAQADPTGDVDEPDDRESADLSALKRELRDAEGFEPGLPGQHVGYGHRLPLSPGEAEALLDVAARNALANSAVAARNALANSAVAAPCWPEIDIVRKIVVASMAYQHGLDGLRGYSNMLDALCAGDFARAADEMLDSLWAHEQAPDRARRLAQAMRSGEL